MASFGRFDPFTEEGDEDFDSYAERFEHYVRATQVSEDLKVSVFVTAIGKQAYRTLKNLLAPTKPEEKTYAELLQILKGYYSPKPLVIAERFRFNRRSQLKNEPVAAFALELKRLAGSCEFGQFLDDALRDRFVAGLRDETAQAELLKKSTLTFQTAYDLAKSGELARTETRKIHPKELGDVNLVQQHPQRTTGTRKVASKNTERHAETTDCSRCGATHDAATCPFRKFRCRACKKMGHLARVCRTTPRSVHSLEESTGLETPVTGTIKVECFPPSVQVPSANPEFPACSQAVVSRRSLGSPVPIDGARETSDAEQVDEQADDANKEPVHLPDTSSAGGHCGGGESQPSQPELRRSTRQRRPPDRY
ncbi:uncharacterized protein LOC125758846 [Rhipicephalus sanguineus]|uniref:uncharacterized protein LOC125758846 n=1 Tax=Rhipicephalus sanguineus TaxID=34632 RepID=UPI0020C48F9C|nr:uncharacterized protein LOC125758846 [Rhipicephalus sanguineus]